MSSSVWKEVPPLGISEAGRTDLKSSCCLPWLLCTEQDWTDERQLYWYLEYTCYQLTLESDKQLGLSGWVWHGCLKNTGFGWEGDFVDKLLWVVPIKQIQPVKRSVSTYRVPSWSWRSTDLAVKNKTISNWCEFPNHFPPDIELGQR